MLALRNCSILLNACHRVFRTRSKCWQLLVADRSEFVGRCFSQSSVSSQSRENTKEDVSPEELAEMRSRMRKLHNLLSSNAGTLADYKPSSDEEQSVSNSTLLKDVDTGYDQSEDSAGQVQSVVDGIGKGLRKHRDIDVLINMPYGHVRFDSMNVHKSKLRPLSERNSAVEEEVPSVKIVKDGRYVFSVNAVEESGENVEIPVDETCQAESRKESEVHDMKQNMFDEQYFDDVLPLAQEKHGSVPKNVRTKSEACDVESNILDEQFFSGALQHSEHQQVVRQKEGDKQRNLAFDVKSVKSDFVDVQYSSNIWHQFMHEKQTEANFTHSKKVKSNVKKTETGRMKPNIFEEQYFGDEKQQSSQSSADDFVGYKRKQNKLIDSENSGMTASVINDENLSLIDNQYFGSYMQTESASLWETQEDECSKEVSSKQMADSQEGHGHSSAHDSHSSFQQHFTSVKANERITTNEGAPVWKEVEDIIKDSVMDEDNTVVVESITQREMKARTRPEANVKHPKTAYDLSVKIKQQRQKKQSMSTDKNQQPLVLPKDSTWSGRVDSKGFKILQDQVIDVQQLTQEQVLLILKDSVIHEDDKLVVLDKPYGLPSHGGPGVHHSVGKLLEPMALKMDKSGHLKTLYLVHRLDKETTGVMVLAKSLQVAEFLLAMFKKRQVVKHYWVITKSVPKPQEGIIDIPMAEDIVGNRYRMALRPRVDSEGRPLKPFAKLGDSYEAVTNYKVLSENGSAALVQCTPETGVKHQIRCHLAFGLNTPILGDHKYSHYSKMAPQKLHPEMLQKLGVRQAKVRHIPMHLHAKAVVLPEWMNGRNLFLSARLPAHFTQNMKWLKLQPPQ